MKIQRNGVTIVHEECIVSFSVEILCDYTRVSVVASGSFGHLGHSHKELNVVFPSWAIDDPGYVDEKEKLYFGETGYLPVSSRNVALDVVSNYLKEDIVDFMDGHDLSCSMCTVVADYSNMKSWRDTIEFFADAIGRNTCWPWMPYRFSPTSINCPVCVSDPILRNKELLQYLDYPV